MWRRRHRPTPTHLWGGATGRRQRTQQPCMRPPLARGTTSASCCCCMPPGQPGMHIRLGAQACSGRLFPLQPGRRPPCTRGASAANRCTAASPFASSNPLRGPGHAWHIQGPGCPGNHMCDMSGPGASPSNRSQRKGDAGRRRHAAAVVTLTARCRHRPVHTPLPLNCSYSACSAPFAARSYTAVPAGGRRAAARLHSTAAVGGAQVKLLVLSGLRAANSQLPARLTRSFRRLATPPHSLRRPHASAHCSLDAEPTTAPGGPPLPLTGVGRPVRG